MSSTPEPAAAAPLRPAQEAWRIVLAALLGVVLWFAQFSVEPVPDGLLPLVDALVGVPVVVAVHWRRRRPLTVALTACLATAVSALAVGAAILALVSLVTTGRWRAVGLVVAGATAGTAVFGRLRPQAGVPWWQDVVATVVGWLLVVGVAAFVRTRRQLAQARAERARTAAREQVARVEQAQTNERARIAREMHDVLAHRISLLAMHAGAMVYREDLSRDELVAAAKVVQENAHQAMVDLRATLGVLREPVRGTPGGPLVEPPQPTLADLPELLADVAAAMDVTVTSELDPTDRWPVTTGRTAYRVVQEGLTNARKHAPGAPVSLRLTGGAGAGLTVELTNPVPEPALSPGPGGGSVRAAGPSLGPSLGPMGEPTGEPTGGLGLIGLAERASLAGGRVAHSATATHFCLRVWLPWPA